MLGSNQRPPPCRDGALPAELIAREELNVPGDRGQEPAAKRDESHLASGAMEVELPDGNRLTLPDGATGADAAAAIGPGLARAALAVKVDGELRDLARPLPDTDGAGPARLEIITDRSGEEALSLIRHDAAHVLAAAVMELYPGVKISIGPPIENGFYYDFDFPEGVTPLRGGLRRDRGEDARAHRGRRAVRPRGRPGRARRSSASVREDQDYKVELIEDLVERRRRRRRSRCTPTVRSPTCAAGRTRRRPSGSRRSSCSRSPVPTGAGTRTKPMLTRVYGTAFFSQKDLERVPRAPRAGARARPSPARPAARAVQLLRRRARDGVLVPGRDPGLQLARRAQPRDGRDRAATPRSRPRSSTTARCGRPRGTGTSTGSTCS